MTWNIPQISGQTLTISLDAGDQLFMVGANGSGKSALIQQLVSSNPARTIRRISAHRQTWFNSGSIDLTPRTRRDLDDQFIYIESKYEARWKDEHAQQKQSAVLFDLVAKDNADARNIRSLLRQVDPQNPYRGFKAAIEVAASVPLFEQLNELLALGTLTVLLENSEGEEILARHGHDGASFSIAQMSDGERSAALMAATVLTVKPETVLLIDEPELHLHRAIIEPFLAALFAQRMDCAFVVSTHEVALPMAHPAARVLMVRSCEWNGDRATTWDVEVLEPDAGLPEDLKRAILGARRRIVFVEGTSGSLDLPLYTALFPDISVVPTGNCVDVERAVTGLRESLNYHHVEAYGLIDRDDRTDDAVMRLAEKHVFALNVCSVEALYYCSDAIAAVAHRQAETLGSDAHEMIESATQKAFNELHQEGLAERMAARRCEQRLRERVLSEFQEQKSKSNTDATVTLCVASPYPNEVTCFQSLVADRNLDGLIARYPLRESRVFEAIARALKYDTRDYARVVVSRSREDGALAQKLKDRIGPLSRKLEAVTLEEQPSQAE